MTRRKGEITSAQIQRDYPHQIAFLADFISDGGGYKPVFDAARRLSLAVRSATVVKDGRCYIVLCFRERADAETIRERFGAYPFDPTWRGRGQRWGTFHGPVDWPPAGEHRLE